MLDKLESILLDQCRLEKSKPLLAGVSGGPDSLCLLSLLHDAGWQVIAAHFNHMLRPEAGEEAAAVEALASRLGVPFFGGRGDVRELAAREKMSIETAARHLRYRFLFEQARLSNAQAVAVGHTADDQVETVLMHLIRGAGLNGLKGMPYSTCLAEYDPNILLVRPLLDMWRLDTVAYCESHGLAAHYDASNDSLDFLRNRLRHELIPALEAYNPRFREAAWRTSKTLSADHELLTTLLQPVWSEVRVRQTRAYVELDLAHLSACSPAIQMHVLQRAARTLLPGEDVGFEDLQGAAAFLAKSWADSASFVGGLGLFREGSSLYVARTESDLPRDQWPQLPEGVDLIHLPIPGSIDLDAGWRLASALWKVGDPDPVEPDWERPRLCAVYLDASTLPPQLELRLRRPGDRFKPLGMDGHSQKLADFLINVKMPQRARARWPLVCAGASIVWIPGYRFAHVNRSQSDSSTFVVLSLVAPDSFKGDISGPRFVQRPADRKPLPNQH